MAQAVAEDVGRMPMSPALQATLLRAREYAAGMSHREVGLEHLLLALSEDNDAAAVMQACKLDLGRLRNDVASFLGSPGDAPSGRSAPGPAISPQLTQILKYATLAAQQGRRPQIDGAIVLAAIVGDGKSMAANFLKAQGLTFEQTVRVLQQSIRDAAPNNRTATALNGVHAAPQRQPELLPLPQPQSRGASAEDILAAARERVGSRVPAALVADRVQETPAGPEFAGPEPVVNHLPPPPLLPPEPEFSAPPEPPPAQTGPPQLPSASPAGPAWAPPPVAGNNHGMPHAAPRPPLPPLTPLAGQGSPRAALPAMPTAYAAADAFPQGSGSPGSGASPPWANPQPQRPQQGPPPLDTRETRDAQWRASNGPAPGSAMPQTVGQPHVRLPAIEASQLTHTIPRRMAQGRPQSVEVRIKRSSLAGGNVTARAISVRLRPAKGGRFSVDQPSPETQWDKAVDGARMASEAAVWRFTVQPLTMGTGELVLAVSARTIAPDGLIIETAIPDQTVAIRSRRNWRQSLVWWGTLLGVGIGSIALKAAVEAVFKVDLLKSLRGLFGL